MQTHRQDIPNSKYITYSLEITSLKPSNDSGDDFSNQLPTSEGKIKDIWLMYDKAKAHQSLILGSDLRFGNFGVEGPARTVINF